MTESTDFWKRTKFSHICILLLFIFSIKFSFLPLNTGRLVFLYCLGMLAVFKNNKLILPYSKEIINAFFLLILYGLYVAIATLIGGGDNLANLLNIILILFQIGITAYLLVFFFINQDLDQFFFSLLIILGLQGILIFVNFIFPAYREFMFQIMPVIGNITEDNVASAFRTRGLMQSSGANVSAYLAIGFLLGVYFLTSFKLSKRDKAIVLICLPWILIGILFTGRTGFVMIPIAFVTYYILLIINEKFRWKKLLILLYLPLIAIIVYFLVKEIYIATNPDGALLISSWERWAFDQFLINFNGDSSTSTKMNTIETLQSYLFIPEDDWHLLFGDPQSWGIIRTDLGYIRMLYAVGIIGSLLFYGGFIQIYYYILKHARSLPMQILLIFIFLWVLIVEYKEPKFSQVYFASTILLMFFFQLNRKVQKDWQGF